MKIMRQMHKAFKVEIKNICICSAFCTIIGNAYIGIETSKNVHDYLRMRSRQNALNLRL